MKGQSGGQVPTVDFERARKLYGALSSAIRSGLVASCHDCSDGGLGAALAESALGGSLGMHVDLSGLGVDSNTVALFSESQSRFVVTVESAQTAAFESLFAGLPVRRIGEVRADAAFRVTGRDGLDASMPIDELRTAWKSPMQW